MYSTDAFSGILCFWKASMISFNHCLSSELWNIPLLKGLQQFLSLQKAHLVLTKKKAHEMPSRKKATKKFVVSFPIISYWQIQLSFEKVIKVLFLDTRQNNSLLQQLQNCITASGKTGHDCRSEKKKSQEDNPYYLLSSNRTACPQIIFHQENTSLYDQATKFS